MNWNVEVLKKIMLLLENKLDNAKTDDEVFMIQDDLYTIKEMINCQEKDKVFEIPDAKNYHIIDNKRYEENKEFLVASAKKNFCKLNRYASCRLSHTMYIPRKMSFIELLDYIEKFLLSYDKRMYETYKNLSLYSRISIGRDYYKCGNSAIANGILNKITTTGDVFIYSRFIHNLKTAATLPHELAHANQFQYVYDPQKIQIMRYSTFSESYAIFIEYIFGAYMQKTPFQRNALDFNRDMIDTAIGHIDYNYSYDDIKAFDIKKVYSNLLAFYWVALYEYEPKLAVQDINWFNQNYGILTDEEILNHYGFDNLSNGLGETINNYIRRRKNI